MTQNQMTPMKLVNVSSFGSSKRELERTAFWFATDRTAKVKPEGEGHRVAQPGGGWVFRAPTNISREPIVSAAVICHGESPASILAKIDWAPLTPSRWKTAVTVEGRICASCGKHEAVFAEAGLDRHESRLEIAN